MPIHRTLAFPVNNTDWRNARRNSDLRASIPTEARAAARKALTLSVDASWTTNQITDAACGLHSHESGDLLPVRVAAARPRRQRLDGRRTAWTRFGNVYAAPVRTSAPMVIAMPVARSGPHCDDEVSPLTDQGVASKRHVREQPRAGSVRNPDLTRPEAGLVEPHDVIVAARQRKRQRREPDRIAIDFHRGA